MRIFFLIRQHRQLTHKKQFLKFNLFKSDKNFIAKRLHFPFLGMQQIDFLSGTGLSQNEYVLYMLIMEINV